MKAYSFDMCDSHRSPRYPEGHEHITCLCWTLLYIVLVPHENKWGWEKWGSEREKKR